MGFLFFREAAMSLFVFFLFKEYAFRSMFCFLYHLNSLRGLDVPRLLGYLYSQRDSTHRLFLSLRTQMKSNYFFFSVSSLLWHITKLLQKAFMLLSSLFLSSMFSDIFSLLLVHSLLSHPPSPLPLSHTHTSEGGRVCPTGLLEA